MFVRYILVINFSIQFVLAMITGMKIPRMLPILPSEKSPLYLSAVTFLWADEDFPKISLKRTFIGMLL